MAEIPTSARVVIIGGGAVGASCLYHLAKAGWTDCVLLEKNELTAGSTWHAAGNVPTFSSSWSIMNMQRYSAELYRGLGAEVDYPMNYHVTGSVRLGHSAERLDEFKRVVGMGRYQGMDLDILAPDEIKSRYPFLETHDLTGALYDPNDGDIDPAQLTQALAKGARNMGAKVERFCPVTAVRREGDAPLEMVLHSSELMPGGSPQSPDEASIERLYADLEALFHHVAREFRGMTLHEYQQHWWQRQPAQGDRRVTPRGPQRRSRNLAFIPQDRRVGAASEAA